MPGSVTVLISADPSLIKTIEGLVASVPNNHLEILPACADAWPRVQQDDVALLLVHVPEGGDAADAHDLVRTLTAEHRPVATLVVSDEHHAEQALGLLRAGAADCLSRPLDLGRLAYLIDVLTVRHRYARPRRAAALPDLLALPVPGTTDSYFYVISPEMHQVVEQVRRVAPKDTNLLLTGETGTGKTRLARLIHELSPRRHEPFLAINCGALSATLIESEIFGHIKGAFTGAERDRPGKFADAGCGTLLLDEIDSLPIPLQAKLLRAVDERVFEPVGSNKSQPLQARLIAATNRSLAEEVAGKRFREDLYYRLNVVGFYLPPLRDQRHVIAPLAEKFRAYFSQRHAVAVDTFAPEAVRALEEFDWPGNVRELRNVVERAVTLCPGSVIQLNDLPTGLCRVPPSGEDPEVLTVVRAPGEGTLAESMEEAELLRITAALRRHKNNRLRAAAELGISRMTLYKKLHKYGLIAAG
jgi:DNA-binding NtrC family response regulator